MALQGVVETNSGGFFEINPTAADVAIQAAIDSLGANGGVITIHPSDSTYQFLAAVTSTKPNVRVNAHGSVLGFNGSTSFYMFRVRGLNWTFDGGRYVDTPASGLGTNQRRIISVEDAGTNGASNMTRILNAKFDVTLGTQTVQNYVCISVDGNAASSATMRRGLYVAGCEFLANVNSIPNTRLVTATTTPYGIHFIKTANSGSQTIIGNSFRGAVASTTLSDGSGNLDTVQVNTLAAIGATSVVFKSSGGTLTGVLQPNASFTIAGDATLYVVTKQATASANTITVQFYPALAVQADVNDAVTFDSATTAGTHIAYGHVAAAIDLSDHNQSMITDNEFVLMSTQAAAYGEGGALVKMSVGDGESGHSRVAGNIFEDINAWYVVRAESVAANRITWVFIEHNKFGRIIKACEEVVSLSKAADFTVIGNNFHNVSGGLHGTTQTNGYPIRYADCRTGIIDHNSGSIMTMTESLVWDGGGNQNVHVGKLNVREPDYA